MIDGEPKTVTIAKNVEIKVYTVACVCGKGLQFSAELDVTDDLVIVVAEHECLQEEK